MPKKLAMISAAGIQKREDFIYNKLLDCPKSGDELVKSYIKEEMSDRQYTEDEINSESANFDMALGFLSFSKNQHKKIAYVDGIYQITQ